MLKIKRILPMSMVVVLGLSASGCKRAPFQELPSSSIPSNVVSRIDSIAHESQKILTNDEYINYGKDTLILNRYFFNSPKKYIQWLNETAAKNIPDTCIGSHTMMYRQSGTGVIQSIEVNDYKNKYINPHSVINSNNVYTRNGEDMYIPVEYYGTNNPDI